MDFMRKCSNDISGVVEYECQRCGYKANGDASLEPKHCPRCEEIRKIVRQAAGAIFVFQLDDPGELFVKWIDGVVERAVEKHQDDFKHVRREEY